MSELKDVISPNGEMMIFNASKKMRDNQIVLEQDLPEEEEVQTQPVKKRTFRFKENKIAELRELYSRVIVRDFGDEYHMSDEEIKRKFDLYDEYKKIGKHKSKYRNIVDFVLAFRECIDFLVKMGKKNSLFIDPDKFVKKALSGEIDVDYFTFPKYTGVDRKDINWKMITEYILDSSKDPREIQNKKVISYLSKEQEEDPDAYLKGIFTDDQFEYIFNSAPIDPTGAPYDEEIDGFNTRGLAIPVDRKSFKKTMKEFPDLVRGIKDVQKSIVGNNTVMGQYEFIYDLQSEAMEQIRRQDKKLGYKSGDAVPEFKGDILSRKDYHKYMMKLDDWIESHQMVSYNGKLVTLEEANYNSMLEELQRNGIDVKKLYDFEEMSKKRERAIKADRKKEKRLKKRLNEIEARRANRDKYKSSINTKKKKKKKKKSMKLPFDDLAQKNGYDNFKSWKKEMEEWK